MTLADWRDLAVAKLVLATGSQRVPAQCSRAWICPASYLSRSSTMSHDRGGGCRADESRRDRRRLVGTGSGLWPGASAGCRGLRRSSDGSADGTPARSAAAGLLKRRVEAQGHRRSSRTPRPQALSATRASKACSSRMAASFAGRSRYGRRRHPAEFRPGAHGRRQCRQGASWSTIVLQTGRSGIYAIGECAEHRGIVLWPGRAGL